jgi:XTP/dITP diphosphohydrolase
MLKNANNSQPCTLPGKVVFFATGNIHKYNEVRSILSPLGFSVAMIRMKGDEIQSESIQDIAEAAVMYAFGRTGLPVFVEDAGLFIHALGSFPGPYAAYVYKTIHNSGILKLLNGVTDRQATFQSVIAYLDPTLTEPVCFYGEAKGAITTTERTEQGKSGFGFDPIFQPNSSNRTFAEMTIEEKNGYSHRADAIRKFAKWRKENR